MLAACGDNAKYKALVALCGLCGARVHEAVRVRPSDINLDDMTMTIHGKGDKHREVPVSASALHHLSDALVVAQRFDTPLAPFSADYGRKVIRLVAGRAGI